MLKKKSYEEARDNIFSVQFAEVLDTITYLLTCTQMKYVGVVHTIQRMKNRPAEKTKRQV